MKEVCRKGVKKMQDGAAPQGCPGTLTLIPSPGLFIADSD